MMLYNPSLRVSKLIATKNSSYMYDEDFHHGINILSGCNGGGKTSIIQLLVFGMGYEVSNWKDEAGACDSVYIGLKVNGIDITIKRDINGKEKQPMWFCFMPIADSLNAGIENWKKHSYSSQYGSISFSQKLFDILNIPEAKADANNNNVTMHQVLRLIYGDQSNASGNIFNIEPFDSAFKRESIGNYLLGLYDNDLYAYKISLIEEDKKLTKLVSEITAIHSVVGKTSFSREHSSIEDEKQDYLNQIVELNKDLINSKLESFGEYKDEKSTSEKIAINNINLKTNLYECESEIRILQYDIEDSGQFISELKNKKLAIKDAIIVNKSISNFSFQVCPCCQSKLNSMKENSCGLCGSETNDKGEANENLLRMSSEIDLQLAESNRIIERKNKKLTLLKEKRKDVRTQLRKSISESSSVITSINNKNESKIYAGYQKIGYLEEKIENLDKIAELLNSIAVLTDERDRTQETVNDLKDKVSRKENIYRLREPEVRESISKNLISVLKKDIGSEDEFASAKNIEFDFASNSISVNGKSSFSESGMVYLYNSFRLALLMTSLEKTYLRVPRFLILDGIENGGMEDSRSKNFQKAVHDLLSDSQVEFQIIFATKSIEGSLDTNDYIVGTTFTRNSKSLNFKA
ncbi:MULTISPECIES: AAA family ATPase [Vibrio]|uniref:AAA family ATPase n=1 Tax=Vibrio TaxID=662 RepID=UPI000D363895|nr:MULTISPECIES: AAA family ATPase [Vibrio]PTP97889.1 AAA family ATPase [Vibrio splendidus]